MHASPFLLRKNRANRFSQMTGLVVTEIVSREALTDRVACMEKWTAIGDICRCMHNFDGVLQVCAAFTNAAVYRLSRTWDRLSKQVLDIGPTL